jgi:hypothetical protein
MMDLEQFVPTPTLRQRVWRKVRRFFKDSEAIFFARLQVLIGALASLVLIFPQYQSHFQTILVNAGLEKYWPVVVIGMGLLAEVLRRRRATDLE